MHPTLFLPPPPTTSLVSPPVTPPHPPNGSAKASARIKTPQLGQHTVLSDLELHLTYKDVGMRQEADSRCFNCLAEQDHQHRMNWMKCEDNCPACPLDRQHQGILCPRLCTLRKQESFWRTKLQESPPQWRRGDCSLEQPKKEAIPSGVQRPQGQQQYRSQPHPARLQSRQHRGVREQGTPPPSRHERDRRTRSRSRSPYPEAVSPRYRNRIEHCSFQTDRTHTAMSLLDGASSVSTLLENTTAREKIFAEAVRISTVFKRHPRIDNVLLEILRLVATFRRRSHRSGYYTPSRDVARYVEYMHEHFPRLISRGNSATRSSSPTDFRPPHHRESIDIPPSPRQAPSNSGGITLPDLDEKASSFQTSAPNPPYLDLDRTCDSPASCEGLCSEEGKQSSYLYGPEDGEIDENGHELRNAEGLIFEAGVGVAPLDVTEITEDDWEDLFKGDV